jgi:hypothetical protein
MQEMKLIKDMCQSVFRPPQQDAITEAARAATLAAQSRGALVDLGITQGMLYEFCEWFCEHNCEESPCKITVSYLHERMEGIKKQMTDHPEYLAKWEKKRDEQKAILRQSTTVGDEQHE